MTNRKNLKCIITFSAVSGCLDSVSDSDSTSFPNVGSAIRETEINFEKFHVRHLVGFLFFSSSFFLSPLKFSSLVVCFAEAKAAPSHSKMLNGTLTGRKIQQTQTNIQHSSNIHIQLACAYIEPHVVDMHY